jgi:hypothetical protein
MQGKNMNESQEDAVRNAWLDLCAVMQHLCGLRETGTLEENIKTEELINASTDSIKDLEKNFNCLLGEESMFRS